MTKTESDFKKLLEALAAELIDIDSKLELLFHLNKRKEDALDELNIAPAFFGLVIDTLQTDTMISLSRFFENRRETLNIFQLLNFVQKNLSVFSMTSFQKRHGEDKIWHPHRQITSQTVVEHRRELKQVESLVKNLHFRRNKRYAHIDREFAYKALELSRRAPLSYADLRRLVKLGGHILNSYLLAFENTSNSFRAVNWNDVDRVIDILEKHRASFED